jgi:hypothetical protein
LHTSDTHLARATKLNVRQSSNPVVATFRFLAQFEGLS